MQQCLIVGGGVIGLSIAYELAKHEMRVELIDRGRPGAESSWAGAGILPPANAETAVHPLDRLRALSHQLHPQWSTQLRDESSIDNEYRRCGGMYLARSVGEAAALHAQKQLWEEEQISVEQLSAEEAARAEPALEPLCQSGRLRAAYLIADEAQLRNPLHLQALHTSCRNRGVTIHSDMALQRLVLEGGRALEAITNRGRVGADHFCICSGAWTHYLLKDIGFSNGLMPVRGQMVLYKCPKPPFQRVLNEGPRYLVPREDGYVLVGSTEEEVGFDKANTDIAIRELTCLARQIVPELTDDKIEKTWAGLRPGSFDGFPYLGAVPGLDNVFVAAGHFRSGIHLSTGTAVVMSQLIRGETPQIDLSAFRVGRG